MRSIKEIKQDLEALKQQISINEMSNDGYYLYFPYEPRIIGILWWGNDYETSLSMFDIAPVDDWKKSKRKVGK